MSGQDKWLGKRTVVITKLGTPPGTSKALGTANDRGVSNAARANQLAMSRRLDVRAEEMRATLVRRSTVHRSYRKKKKAKKKKRALTGHEVELALLETLEFMSRRPLFGMCGNVQFTDFDGPGAAAARIFKLTDRDLRKVKRCFDSIDTDQSGSITQGEFFDMLELKDTPFTRQLCQSVVFEIADSDENNNLTFDEFVLGVSIVCTLTRDQLLYFVFRCFDTDNSGNLSRQEFLIMSEAVNEAGGGFFDGNFAQLLDKFDTDGDGNVDFDEFLLVDTYFPMAFFPVFRMQGELQKKTLKLDKWLSKVSEYNKGERHRAMRRDSKVGFTAPRPFIERMVKLGAMKQVMEVGGLKALRRLDNAGSDDGGTSRSRNASSALSGFTTGRSETSDAGGESARSSRVSFNDQAGAGDGANTQEQEQKQLEGSTENGVPRLDTVVENDGGSTRGEEGNKDDDRNSAGRNSAGTFPETNDEDATNGGGGDAGANEKRGDTRHNGKLNQIIPYNADDKENAPDAATSGVGGAPAPGKKPKRKGSVFPAWGKKPK